ncbi:hypothetical protein A6P39_044300 (plasmid) [Streptomyces sp. FXJ1.172]|uniref:hypothetical protein n=1 Tax=Streptomyces sp. FXJ1.172 TaxID=710705 RepID=UPI001F24C1CB|nr:hypothetical protein [Streptomyces sp. FXJ1.172]WEP00729.1 hypothetical protein A6P39_044300 [Streptomyces sp. FXJ1.172]
MAPKIERIQFLRAVRQLHRVRSFYAVGVLLWAVSAAWTGWQAPGSRQMWVSVLLLAVFTALLTTATLSLLRLPVPATGRLAQDGKHPPRPRLKIRQRACTSWQTTFGGAAYVCGGGGRAYGLHVL